MYQYQFSNVASHLVSGFHDIIWQKTTQLLLLLHHSQAKYLQQSVENLFYDAATC